MKIITTIIALLVVLTVFSQISIKKSSIDSGGASVTNSTTSVLYTIGEVAVQENTQGNIHISEGFISPNIIDTVGLDDYTPLTSVQLYPNPTIDFVNINFATKGNYTITVYDVVGKVVLTSITPYTDKQQIALNQFANGIYMLLIRSEKTKQFKSYRIVKH